MMWTEGGQVDHLTFAGLRGKGGSSKSSSSSYSAGTSTTDLPSWVTDASQGALSQAQSLANQPYNAYTGQLVADPSQATQQAYQQIYGMQGLGMPQYGQAIGTAQGLLGQVNPLSTQQIQGLTDQLYGGYLGNVVAPTAGLLSPYMQGQGASMIGQGAQSLMNPYIGSVIGPTMQLGQQALAQNLQQIGANANQANAYGGTRQGVMEGVAQSQAALGEANLLGNMLNTGWQQALQPATAAEGQAYGGANTLAGQLQSGYTGQQQVGTGLAQTNLGLGTSALSSWLPSLLQNQQAALTGQTNLLSQAGTAQQQQAQNQLDAAYGQWYEQQQDPYLKNSYLLSALGSIPYGTTTSSSGYNYGSGTSTNTPSTGSQLGSAVGTMATLASMI